MAETFITLRTNWTPALTFNPVKKDSSAVRGGILKLLQPSADINIPVVGNVHYAPYGEPTGWGTLVLFVILIFAVYGIWKFWE